MRSRSRFERGLGKALFALAGEDAGSGCERPILLVEAALLGFGDGALDAPVLNALVDAADEGEVGLDPLAGGVEGEGGGEVERHRDHQGEDDGGAGQVEVVDHRVGEQAAGDAFDGQRVAPVEGVREQADGGWREDDPEAEAEETRHGRAGGALAHPAEADTAEDDGQQESGDADGLEDEVGEPGADEAGPVVRRPRMSSETAPGLRRSARRRYPPTVSAEGSVGV